eukprot:7057401-Pyramimonas_sp.AAC.1
MPSVLTTMQHPPELGLAAMVESAARPFSSGEHLQICEPSFITSFTLNTSRLPMRPAGWFMAYLPTRTRQTAINEPRAYTEEADRERPVRPETGDPPARTASRAPPRADLGENAHHLGE